MVQKLGAHVDFAEDKGLLASTHKEWLTTIYNSSSMALTNSSGLQGHMIHIHTCFH